MKKATGFISILTCIFILAISFPFSVFTDIPSLVISEEDEIIIEETKAIETELLSYSNQGFVTYTEKDYTFRWAVSNKTLSDGSTCTGMQGFNAGTTYAYAAKTGSSDTRCAIVRTNMNDGSQTVMNYYSSLSATSPSPCDTAGHANDMVVRGTTENGATVNYLYISTMKTPHAITRMKISGSNLYFTGSFSVFDTSGNSLSFAAIKWIKTSGGYHYFLLKKANSFYYTKISTTASGGPISNPTKVNCYRIFNIDTKNAIFATSNSTYSTIAGIEDWTNQGFCYDNVNKMIYVPIWDSATNRNAIITFNVTDVLTDAALDSQKNNTPVVFPTKLSFLAHSNEFFEIESCDFRTGQGTTGDLKLYFNVNSSAAKEGIYSFNSSRDKGPFTPYVTSDSIIYTVKYHSGGGSGSMGSTRHIKGISAALRNNKFTLSGFNFVGWYLHRKSDNKWLYEKSDGNVSWYLEGKQPIGAQKALYENQRFVSQLTSVNGDTINAYAQWNSTTTDNTLEGYSPIDLGTNFHAHIRQSVSGLYVTAKDTSIYVSKGVTEAQQWCFTRNSDGSYTISSPATGYAWDIPSATYIDGRKIQLYQPNGTTAQKFFIYYIQGQFYFRSAGAYKTVDIDAASSNMQIYSCATGNLTLETSTLEYEARSFEIVKYCLDNFEAYNDNTKGDFYAYIKNNASGLYMTAKDNDVVFTSLTYKENQKWFITLKEDGSHELISASTGKALDVTEALLDAATNVDLYERNGTKAQAFYFHKFQDGYVIKPSYASNVVDMDANTLDLHIYAYGTADIQLAAQRFSIIDEKDVLSSITISTKPTKTDYFVGDALDATGLTLKAKYKDGKTAAITSGYTVDTDVLSTAGTIKVTVAYNGKTAVFNVNVTEKAPEALVLKTDSLYTKDKTYISNVKAQTTADTVKANFENETISILDAKGNEISSSAICGTGYRICLMKNGEIADSVTIVISGDVDGSGLVDSTDYIRVKSYFIDSFSLENEFFLAGDTNNSGNIDATDYLSIKHMFLSK